MALLTPGQGLGLELLIFIVFMVAAFGLGAMLAEWRSRRERAQTQVRPLFDTPPLCVHPLASLNLIDGRCNDCRATLPGFNAFVRIEDATSVAVYLVAAGHSLEHRCETAMAGETKITLRNAIFAAIASIKTNDGSADDAEAMLQNEQALYTLVETL